MRQPDTDVVEVEDQNMCTFRRCSLIAVVVLALGMGCNETQQREFSQGIREKLFAECEESAKLVHSRTIAQTVGLSAPSGGPSVLYGIGHLCVMDAYFRSAWSQVVLKAPDEDGRRLVERTGELYSILRLFVAPANVVKP